MDLIEFFQRAKNFITSPVEEWQVIKEEQANRSGVVRNYVLPFIFLLAITTFLGIFLFRNYVTVSIMVLGAVVTSLGAFLSIYISAYIINELSPRFESKKDFTSPVCSYHSFLLSFLVSIPYISYGWGWVR